MPYTLLGAPALGFDLARLPGGARVAAVLRTALTADVSVLTRLAACRPPAPSRTAWARALAALPPAEQALSAVPLAGEALGRAAAGETEMLRRLEVSLLGDEHALARLVRDEALAATGPSASAAADVLVDAAVAAYREADLDPLTRRAMAAPLIRSGVRLRDLEEPCGLPVLDDVLDEVAGADRAHRRRWRAVVDRLRPQTAAWAPAMHQATWALSLTVRVEVAADAQLRAVAAFHAAGFTARDAAYGVWNALCGVVHALAAIDLLGDADAETLLRPWTLVRDGEAEVTVDP